MSLTTIKCCFFEYKDKEGGGEGGIKAEMGDGLDSRCLKHIIGLAKVDRAVRIR